MAANGVKLRHKSYDLFAPKWRRVRDVVAGQDAIYIGATLYLPKLAEETPEDYNIRLKRTPFYNATWRTMAAFVGMLFRKAPTIDAPENLKKLLLDVTMTGKSFNDFAEDITLEDIEVYRVGILVDYPMGPLQNADGTPISIAQAQAENRRPSMVMYKAEAIINWKHEYINNRRVLTQVRLWEQANEVINEFETKPYGVIRVLDLFNGKYRVRRFKEENEEQIGWDVYPVMNGQPLDFIPFYIVGDEDEISEPELIDLVDLNLKHFVVSADYEHGCHMTGLPTPVIVGMQPEGFRLTPEGGQVPVYPKLYIGSTTAWILPQGVTDVKYLEFNGTGLSALSDNLAMKEAQMAALGARMLTPDKAGVEATETVAMRHSGEHSILASIANAVSVTLTDALKTFAKWAGVTVTDDNIKFQINRDFMPFMLSPQALTSLLGIVQAGKMSSDTFYTLLQRADLADGEVDWEEEQAKIDSDPSIPKPVPPTDPNNPNPNPNPNQPNPKPKPTKPTKGNE